MPGLIEPCDFIGGWIGGMLGLLIGHPLDTLKLRQQILSPGNSIISIAKSMYKVDGISGFFRGVSYPLLGSGVYNGLFFGFYGNSLRWLQGVSGPEVRKMCCEGGPPNANWHRDVFLAGCTGGLVTVLYSCPLEIVKIKLQAQTAGIPAQAVTVCPKRCKTEPVYRGPFDALKKIYQNYGFSGLYRGLWVMIWRDVPTFGLYTLTYEHVLCWLKQKDDRSPYTTKTSQVLAGGFAGILSWAPVAPLDVIKSRIQADDFGRPVYRGMLDCLLKTLRQDGVRALFLGVGLSTFRSFPVNAVTFLGYELVVEICSKWVFTSDSPHGKRKS